MYDVQVRTSEHAKWRSIAREHSRRNALALRDDWVLRGKYQPNNIRVVLNAEQNPFLHRFDH